MIIERTNQDREHVLKVHLADWNGTKHIEMDVTSTLPDEEGLGETIVTMTGLVSKDKKEWRLNDKRGLYFFSAIIDALLLLVQELQGKHTTNTKAPILSAATSTDKAKKRVEKKMVEWLTQYRTLL